MEKIEQRERGEGTMAKGVQNVVWNLMEIFRDCEMFFYFFCKYLLFLIFWGKRICFWKNGVYCYFEGFGICCAQQNVNIPLFYIG